MVKSEEVPKNFNKIYILQSINILLLITTFHSYDLFYLLFGYPNFFLEDINSIKRYEMVLFRQITEKVRPFVLITFILKFFFNLHLLKKFKKFKKLASKFTIIYWINILIFLFYILVIIANILNLITPSGLLG
jgi:hypothetical protein